MQNIIHLQDIFLTRNSIPILQNISWTIKPNEHWAFIGANGSGKTMTLRIIAGYIWASSGKVSVLDHKFGEYDLRELRKSIGYVSTHLQYQLLRPFPVLEVVLSGAFASIGLYDTPSPKIINRAKELLNFLDCSHLFERTYDTLSSGEQKRVLIARALITDPKLLILDEPCTGLDLATREHFLAYISQIKDSISKPSIIFVTHHIEEILPFITHCFCIKAGKVLKQGEKQKVLCSEVLSNTLGIGLEIKVAGERYECSMKGVS